MSAYVISGYLISERKQPLPGLRIEAWDRDLAIDDLLGSAVSDEKGFFTITFQERYYTEVVFDRRPDIFFRVYRGDILVADTSDRILWNAENNAQNIVIPVPVEPDTGASPASHTFAAAATVFSVDGRVYTTRRVPVAGVVVIAYDRRLSGAVVVGEAVTDAEGNYRIAYTPESLQDAMKPAIEIRAVEPGSARKELGKSAVRYNAGATETIDVFVAVDRLTRPTEYERLMADIKPALGNMQLHDLHENGEREDLTVLSNRSGWDARAVAMAAQAERLNRETGIPPAHYYALFRSGVADSAATITGLPTQTVEETLQAAIKAKIIPPYPDITETIHLHRRHATEALLKTPPAAGVSTLDAMLDLRLNDDQKRNFADIYREHAAEPDKLWSALETQLPQQTVQQLRLDGKLGYLTLQNAPLIQRLHEMHKPTDAADLVGAGLYKAAEWKKIIGQDVPKGLKADTYAAGLAGQIQRSYPTLVVAEMVRNNELHIGDGAPGKDVARFLHDNAGKNAIGSQPVKTWEGFAALKPAAKDAVKRIERLYQMSPSNEAMAALSEADLTSAYQIVQYTRSEFMQKYGGDFTTAAEADMTYTKAHEVHSAVVNVATMYLTYRAAPNVYGITGQLTKAPNELIAYPTLEELFDTMDYCACEECRSVLSPAAYMVELLQFIDLQAIPHDKQNPVTVLLGRRPDIQHIQLTCENTHVALPYIDLVNEILEHYIVHGNLTTYKGHDIAKGTKTADLLADPQYIDKNAYAKTKQKVFPYDLPFDQPLEALRLLFQIWDVSLEDGLRIFGNQLAARKERLGLNTEEYKALTDTTFHTLPEYFGEAAGITIDALNTAIANGKTFSRRLGISYEELARLLETRFINPAVVLVPNIEKLRVGVDKILALYNGDISGDAFKALLPADINTDDYNGDVVQWLQDNEALINSLITLTDMTPETTECTFADVQLRYALPTANNKLKAIAYHRFHRFIRLWKKEGWSIETTDGIITALSSTASEDITEGNIDAAFTTLLARIANFKHLMARLSVSDKKMPAWLVVWDNALSQDTRRTRLAELLKMPVQTLLDLSAITGVDPLADDMEDDTPSLVQFVDIVESLKAVSLRVEDLNYILRHKDDSGKLTPDAKLLLKHIKTLRDALTAVERENSIAPDNADFAFAKTKMALVYDINVVNDFFGFLTDSNIYETPFTTIAEALPEKLTGIDTRLGYEPFRKVLTYSGVMTPATRTALNNAADALVLGDVDGIGQQGALDAFIADFKTRVQNLLAAGNAALANFATAYPELKALYDTVKPLATPAEQTSALLDGILPELKEKLKTNALRLALSNLLKIDIDIATAATEKAEVLHAAGDPAKAIADDFTALEGKANFNGNQLYELYLDAPATDDYLLYVKAPKDTVVTLTVDGDKVIDAAAVPDAGEVQNAQPVSLQAATLYPVKLHIAGLPAGASATLLWRTKGMAKTDIPDANLYLKSAVENAATSLVRLQKAMQLQRLLSLTAAELSYFAADNAGTKDFLNDLDTDGTIAPADLHDLWHRLSLIVWFAQLRSETEPEENTWVQVLIDPETKTPQGKSVLLGINSWKQDDLDAVLAKLGLAIGDMSKLPELKRVRSAMEFIGATGYAASAVLPWITDSPTTELIADIKAQIRATTDDAAWLETMQSVNDPLRNKQRDALIHYVLYYQRPAPGIDTADKLYEYFLIDVQMDACMQTSRIRLALSSIQLFINRCLMNLEPQVAPSSIRTQQWEWMKRYRVWEANRKVFLYPENWLEPELRDNKSSFFRELEGELLQADITDELAETAFLNYLKKLDEVARLEIVGTYLQENEKGNQNDDILHVIGRTNGNTRQYYYRRYEYGYWTPWEKISLTIDGDHVVPVVWKGRLFLFWLAFVEKPEEGNKFKKPQDMGNEAWGDHAQKKVEIIMGWGEYYKGKWTSPKSSDMSNPITFYNLSSFNPKDILVFARTEKKNAKTSERLIFFVYYDNDRYATVTYTSKNCAPIVEHNTQDSVLYENVGRFNYDTYRLPYSHYPVYNNANLIDIWAKEWKVSIKQPVGDPSKESILTRPSEFIGTFSLLAARYRKENQWEAPLFFSDERSVFFVQPDEQYIPSIPIYDGYFDGGIVVGKRPGLVIDIPPLYEQPRIPNPKDPVINPQDPLVNPLDPLINPVRGKEQVFSMNPNYRNILPTTMRFAFDQAVFDGGGKVTAPAAGQIEGNISHL